jgi:hypothetical protein
MAVLHTLHTRLKTETGLAVLFAFVFLVIAADCAVTAFGLLAR